MRSIRVAALAAVLLGALAMAAGAAAQPARPAPAPALAWKACDDGFQCATLAVPRTWANPRGAKIRLSLIRLPATAPPSRRIGSLLVNFGGPGAPGVVELRKSGELIRRATLGRFDVVSWDPRGVATSAGIRCPEGNGPFYGADPNTPAGVAAVIGSVQERARACYARYGSFLGAIGTNQVVRDMDAIRRAVGDEKTTFLGLSYGTRVGGVYAQTFPTRVRALVLDGSLPPVSTAKSTAIGLADAFERALHLYLERCAATTDCIFGPDPLARYDALVAGWQATPPSANGRVVPIGYLYQTILAALVNVAGTTELAESVLGPYLRTGDASGIQALGDVIASRRPDGTYGGGGNGTETFQFINCLDWQDRPTPGQVAALADQVRPFAPRLGAFAVTFFYAGQAGCPLAPTPVPPPSAPDVPPVLVVGNMADTETPIEWSQALSASLPGSRLLVSQSFGHTAFVTSPCVARRAGRYLVTGRLPPVGTVCHDPAPPRGRR